MSKQWYYRVAGREFGPCTANDLAAMAKAGKLLPSDEVRTQDMSTWTQASRVRGLAFAAVAPAAQPSAWVPPPIPAVPHAPATIRPSSFEPKRSATLPVIAAAVFMVVLVVGTAAGIAAHNLLVRFDE